jgi:ABC-type antimicrobial peptide transport system permease subunit
MLVALLFRLSLEQRAREAGLLMSVGLSQQRITRLFLIEGLGIALIGVILGSLSGIAYALLMILGLRTWWIDAVVTPFLELHIRPLSLAGGAAMGLIISLLTIRLTVAALRKTSLLGLLAGQIRSDAVLRAKRQRLVTAFAAFALLMAVAAGISAAYLEGEAQAGAFFGGGAGVLIAMLLLVSQRLKRSARPDTSRGGSFGMPQLVVRNVGRNPGRSTLTMGLMATACFLIVAISAFRLAPTEQGTGGFPLLARTDTPIFDDLNVSTTRRDVFGSSTNVLEETQFYALRMKSGDDASCRNLYQAQQPQVLGMPPSFIARFDKPSSQHFGWASTGPMENGETNPWRALNQEDLGIVPVILDKNTAMYSLHLYGGVGEEFDVDYESAGTVRFRVVGLLSGSVFQGSLLVSERHLLRQFPDISGYQFFAIDCPAQRKQEVARLLEKQYRDQGWTNIDTRELLADLLAVQNTYLSTFQSLGGLGLLLGTFGLAAVQLRSVFERRAELALLRATGFSQKRLGSLILWEHATLLLSGLGIGVLAALLAVIPHAWSTEVRPPWETLFWVLIFILTMGLLTGYLALRPLVRAPLMHALRGR